MNHRRSALVLLAVAIAPLTCHAGRPAGPVAAGPPSWARSADAASSHRGLGDASDSHDAASATAARKQQERELLKAHRDQLDLDPQGRLIVRDEIIAFAPDRSALEAATASGFTVRRERAFAGLDAALVVLSPPQGLSAKRALLQLRSADPQGAYDYNHIYLQSAATVPVAAAAPQPAPTGPAGQAHATSAMRRVGLVDGGIAADHPTLRGLTLRTHGCDGTAHPSAHGTAVASLLAGGHAERGGPATGLELYAADVYCGAPTGGAADALSEAIAWLVAERVAVINVSLVGPPNLLLERVVRLVTERGHLIVAAVGNDGPAAPPLYPAAYPGVIAVTAVDRHDKVLVEAGRGPHVHFAAPGADIQAARLPDGESEVRGTSFAAPRVAALLAERLRQPDRAAAADAVHALEREALDLGAPGFDPVYGYGCLGCPGAPNVPAVAGTR